MNYYHDDKLTLHLGDALEILTGLPDGSVDCIVTSPPYYGLRDYGTEGQYGLEETPAEYVETLRALFHEARRVLADDGTFWLNIGDSYGRGSRPISQPAQSFEKGRKDHRPQDDGRSLNLPPKNLLGIPWRVAFALQDDGWILRSSIVWHKPNGMPESVRDRVANKHENLFMFTKKQNYWFDLDALRIKGTPARAVSRKGKEEAWNAGTGLRPHEGYRGTHESGRNPGDVWSIPTQPFPGAHFATMPQELARRCIVAGCKPAGTVLDPFSGSGTTGLVAQNNGRKYVGIDISAEYLELSLRTRLSTGTLDMEALF